MDAHRPTIAILSGAVLTLLVAWLPAVAHPEVPARYAPQRFLQPIEVGGTEYKWGWNGVRHHALAHSTWIFRKARILDDVEPDTRPLPAWAPIPDAGMRVDIHAYGWPWPSLKATRSSPSGEQDFLTVTRRVELPVRPLPIGLCADVIFWALAMTLLSVTLVAIRAQIRRRRGLCPRCAYDRTGEGSRCPECGHS